MHSNKGFSLIELMIVVAIVGILALVASPIYSSYMVRLRYTQLITHALNEARIIEYEYASGGKGAVMDFINKQCISGGGYACDASAILPSGTTIEHKNPTELIRIFTLTPPQSSIVVRYHYGGVGKGIYISYEMGVPRNDGSYTFEIHIDISGEDRPLYNVPIDGRGNAWNIVKLIKNSSGTITSKDGKEKYPFDQNRWYCAFVPKYYNSDRFALVSEKPTICRDYIYAGSNYSAINLQEI